MIQGRTIFNKFSLNKIHSIPQYFAIFLANFIVISDETLVTISENFFYINKFLIKNEIRVWIYL